jgi:hypothetical protein
MTAPRFPDFVQRTLPDGSVFVDMTRLTDGRVMCCICFNYFFRAGLNPIGDSLVEDVCRNCAAMERRR